jgi:uncharacterized membrane-anchored protein YhcB (DUF1043 family)
MKQQSKPFGVTPELVETKNYLIYGFIVGLLIGIVIAKIY